MGAGASSKAKKAEKIPVRNSSIFSLRHMQSKFLKRTSSSIYTIRIPPGAPPLGAFSAFVNGELIEVEVPEEACEGDFVEVDLKNQVAVKEDEATKVDEETREAAKLFLKYDTKNLNCIDKHDLKSLLQNEFKLDINSKEIDLETKLAGTTDQHSLTFEEFLFWHKQVKLRVKYYQHERKTKLFQRSTSMKNVVAALAPAQEESTEEINHLHSENKALQAMYEKQRGVLHSELQKLKRESSKIVERKKTIRKGSVMWKNIDTFQQRMKSKERMLQVEKEENERIISTIKEEFVFLTQERESKAEEQRRRLKKKLEAKKKMQQNAREDQ